MMVNTLIVGGGPAGLALLIAAGRSGSLDQILADGVCIAERGPSIGAGRIGRFGINSDSTGNTLASAVLDNPHPALAALRDNPITKAVATYGMGSVPLTLVSRFLDLIGTSMRELLAGTRNRVLLHHEAISSAQTGDGYWRTRLRCVLDGTEIIVQSRFIVLATGGHQPPSCLERRYVAGKPLLPTYADKLVPSDDALTEAGLEAIGERLRRGRGRMAIIGSSSSAMACANAVLSAPYGNALGEAAVTLLHRRPLRIFYPSAAEAAAEGYDEFTSEDICPISGFVFRLAGLRLEARELLMAVRGIAGRGPEKRLRLHQVGAGPDARAAAALDEADLIVVGLGYRPRALPLFAASGRPISLLADEPRSQPLVDAHCNVLDSRAKPIDRAFAIGLGSGFFSREIVGGERSFSGQTNSLWQWQNAIGDLIARRIHTATARPAERTWIGAPLGLAALS